MATKTHVYRANRYDMYRKAVKQVSNTGECEVLVLPVHSRETRRVLRDLSCFIRDASRETVVSYL